MNRREVLLALAALGAAPFVVDAQPADKVYRVGFLGSGSADSAVARGRGDRVTAAIPT